MMKGMMLGFGISYQDDCENGATDYLVTGGAIILLLAICDDLISKSESCVIRTLLCILGFLPLVSLVVIIWGAFVIFPAYSTWTFADEDSGVPDYCAKPPFLCAFVLLILDSVAILFLIVCLCCLCCSSFVNKA